MRKVFSLFLVFIVLLLSLCACQNEVNNALEQTLSPSENSVGSEVTETLSEKLISEIDAAYVEEQKDTKNGTTLAMIELADKYTEKWKQVADEYYDKIMNYNGIAQLNEDSYSSDDLHTFVSNMKTNWEEYNKEQCENYSKTLQTIYGNGTIIGPICANYKYEMQKDWALQLVGIYQQLYVK